jgi:hypothetical protein
MGASRKVVAAIDNSLLEPIGRVTVNFAMLEQTVAFGVWLLIVGNDSTEQRTAQILTAELSFKRLVDLYSCLYRHRFPESRRQAEVDGLCTKLRVMEERRNVLTHSFWGAGGAAGQSTRLKITAKAKGFRMQSETLRREDIQLLAEDISELAASFQEEYLRIFTENPPSHQEPHSGGHESPPAS